VKSGIVFVKGLGEDFEVEFSGRQSLGGGWHAGGSGTL
jgi:hypothetical protein